MFEHSPNTARIVTLVSSLLTVIFLYLWLLLASTAAQGVPQPIFIPETAAREAESTQISEDVRANDVFQLSTTAPAASNSSSNNALDNIDGITPATARKPEWDERALEQAVETLLIQKLEMLSRPSDLQPLRAADAKIAGLLNQHIDQIVNNRLALLNAEAKTTSQAKTIDPKINAQSEADDPEIDSTAGIDLSFWLLIESDTQTVTLKQNEKTLRVFRNASIGQNGATYLKIKNDGKTPLGEFRINRINKKSKFHRFFAFDYPTSERAQEAFNEGLIDWETYDEIVSAIQRGRTPPQTTPLGGNLGLHGIGDGSTLIHQRFNWTQGCVALTNHEIDELSQYIGIGTRVVIK